jgi:hypothetical protein
LRFSFPLAFHFSNRGRLNAAIDHAKARAMEITGVKVAEIRFLDESMAGMFHVGLNNHSWKLSIDVGGGTADIALMHNDKRVVADSIHLGGDLVMERHAAKLYPGEARNVAMSKLGHRLRGHERFSSVFGQKAPDLSTQLLALSQDYAARVVAGALTQIEQGHRPGLSAEDFANLQSDLKSGGPVPISVYLFGGAWRLAELVHEFEWAPTEDARIQAAIGKVIEDRVNGLLALAGRTTRVRVAVHHTHLHQLGGEKAAVALGLLRPFAEGSLSENITGDFGIITVNGLDEEFEGAQRSWHEWVGAGVKWRTSPDTVQGRAVSRPLGTPAFTDLSLREWPLEAIVGDSDLQMKLTPSKESPYYRGNNQHRTRSAMAVTIEACFAKKFRA